MLPEESELTFKLVTFPRGSRDPSLQLAFVGLEPGDEPAHERGLPVVRVEKLQRLALILLLLFDPLLVDADLLPDCGKLGLLPLDLILIRKCSNDQQTDAEACTKGGDPFHRALLRAEGGIAS